MVFRQKLVMIILIELGLCVIRVCANFLRGVDSPKMLKIAHKGIFRHLEGGRGVEPKYYWHQNIVGQGPPCQKWRLFDHPGSEKLIFSKYLHVWLTVQCVPKHLYEAIFHGIAWPSEFCTVVQPLVYHWVFMYETIALDYIHGINLIL